jgi:hypothetical protein
VSNLASSLRYPAPQFFRRSDISTKGEPNYVRIANFFICARVVSGAFRTNAGGGRTAAITKTIQLYFTNPAHAPKWTQVVGNAEIQARPTGSKYARAVNKDENFWVAMLQSNTSAVTTVTLSRSPD